MKLVAKQLKIKWKKQKGVFNAVFPGKIKNEACVINLVKYYDIGTH